MNISYNWLRELTGSRLAPREAAERLTMVGLAVDTVHEAGDDSILEFDLTSNRPDCLSHLGIARELAVIERRDVRLPAAEFPIAGRAAGLISVEIRDPDLCPRYAARVVRGVRVAPSPAWLADRLQAIGQRPINNVADITNYVLHELGQPLHAFDFAKLTHGKIVVRRAVAGEKLKTLDGVERRLDEQMLVIADAARAVAIAGVMGGEESEVSGETRDVLIESAYFDPVSVRRTARALGLHTEASYRFERGVDYEGALRAQERAVALICEVAGGTATEDALDVYPKIVTPPTANLRFARVKELTGLDVPDEEATRILRALGFRALEDSQAESSAGGRASSVAFVAPTWRGDVEREEDLVEEVARHTGYEKISEELPASNVAGAYRPGDDRRRAARRALASAGFDEAINFSFIAAAHDGQYDLLPGLRTENAAPQFVTLDNPIIEGATRMRPTLLPGLLDAVRHNFNHGTRHVRLFEMGRVFAEGDAAKELPHERESLALVMTGGATEENRADVQRQLDFYDLRGAAEAVGEATKTFAPEFVAAEVKHLSEGQAAQILIGGHAVGYAGRLVESISAEYKFKQPVYVAEVDFGELLRAAESPARYAPLARYPSVTRDKTVTVSRRTTFAELRRAVTDLGLEYCRRVSLVGTFEPDERERAVTIRTEYRADDRTLSDDEVSEMQQRVDRELAKFAVPGGDAASG